MTKEYLGVKDGKLAPCPHSPNCVSTQAKSLDKAMDSLPFIENISYTKSLIKQIINEEQRTSIQSEQENYLHVIFTSKLLKFKDDVEFYFDESSRVVHFRSASRAGYSDLGVNRKRMENIRRNYLRKIESGEHS
ncbi:DUF1499 domain-containing protein [Halobacillus shinanisalinarum]|uniref:DUF1499 domain-containing protein n=1 Tax=Halobacillus shinanisalinarum TaxID=2932258 RepID=A0ABY4GX77_9BACI|nr:DUF1499 domain-containing protein [Halobacillus shinanisalinarum]UOQ92674.1 DUF1499 domain-containing protein [Halobacillus shinanisalinarum]